MRTAPSATVDALYNAKERGIVPRQFVLIKAKDRTTEDINPFGFHMDIEPAFDVTVLDGVTNILTPYTYYGAGAIRDISKISLVVGTTVRRVTIEFSNVHVVVNDMARGFEVRNAEIQIHRGLLDPTSGLLVDNPLPHFVGTINNLTPNRPRVGGEGSITVEAVSITNELTRTNPAKASDAHQTTRDGDEIMQYADIMGEVKVQWGGKQ